MTDTTIAAERLRVAIMAMTEPEQNALATALSVHAAKHREPRMRSFYAALSTFVDEAHVWAVVRDHDVDLRLGDLSVDGDTSTTSPLDIPPHDDEGSAA